MIGIILHTLYLLFKTTCVNFFCNRSWLVWTTTKFHIFYTKSLKKCRINIQQKFPSNNFYLNKYKLLKIISINCSNCSEFSFSLRGPKFWNDVLDKKDEHSISLSFPEKLKSKLLWIEMKLKYFYGFKYFHLYNWKTSK